MKKLKKLLLPILLITPLFMANSPSPYASPEEYTNFSYSFVSKELGTTERGEDVYHYYFNITNTGSGYIKSITSRANGVWGEDVFPYSNTFLSYPLLPPNESSICSLSSFDDLDPDTFDFQFRASGYVNLLEDAVSFDTGIITFEYDEQREKYNYYIDVSYDEDKFEEDYFESLIIEINYQGEKIVVYRSRLYYKVQIASSDEPLDLSKLSIDKVVITRTYYHFNRIEIDWTPIGEFFRVVGIIFYISFIVAGVFAVSGVIFLIIFLSIKAIKRRKRMKTYK